MNPLTGLQDQFEGLATAVYTADETVVGEHSAVNLAVKACMQGKHSCSRRAGLLHASATSGAPD